MRHSFGNDACFTNKRIRPKYAMSQGDVTIVLKIDGSLLEQIIDSVTNNPLNIEKLKFLNKQEWFKDLFSTAKAKLIDAMHLSNFLPGQKIITEGCASEDQSVFVIVSGTCNLVVTKTFDKFQSLELNDNP